MNRASIAHMRALPQRALLAAVRGYRFFLSPWLGSSCRFEPTCSAYALTALQRHGAITGSRLTLWRLLRCHPWCAGGVDHVPEHVQGLFTRLVGDERTVSSTTAAPLISSREKNFP